MRHLVLSLVLALAACANAPASESTRESAAESAASASIPEGRLPLDVIPEHYALNFHMNPDDTSFSGHVAIKVKLKKPGDVIWLHGQDFRVQEAKLRLADGRALDIDYKQVNDAGVVRLGLPETVKPQEATLVFDYTADYFRGLDGAYRVKAGEDWYVFTQFEAVAARRVFPSFDEPSFKTPFTMEFTIPESDRIVANTPVASDAAVKDGMHHYRFKETKPVPTYLVAFAIGPLDIVDGPSIAPNKYRKHAIPLRGVAVKGKGPQFKYALDHAGEFVQILEDYFGIAYPYEKLDLIAVPDFSAGAMENVGAITFREILLLIPDPETAPTWQLQAYAAVTAHELAHQWFGNLVTMPWWDDIWLNEAFATWTEMKVMQRWPGEYPIEEEIAGTLNGAMRADSLAAARQIRQPITSTHDIENAFDDITYSKGGSVLRMFEQYLGEDVFQQGVRYHLERFRFGNANVFDFLESLSHAAGKDIAPAFKSFLFQPGIPLIDVAVNCDDDAASVSLSQSRYLPLGSRADRDMEWKLPVCMKYGDDKGTHEECVMLDKQAAEFPLKSGSCPAWLMPNADSAGYYLWTLDDTGYRKLLDVQDKLSMLEMLSVVSSIKAGFAAGTHDTEATLQALAPLAKSKNAEVSESPMSLLSQSYYYLVDKGLRDAVASYSRRLYGSYDVAGEFEMGKAPSDSVTRQHHARVAGFLAWTGWDEKVRKAATKAGHELVGFGGDGKLHMDRITPDLQPLALSVAARESGADFYEHLVKLFKASDNPRVRNGILGALGVAVDPELTKRTRALLLDPALKRNEVPSLLRNYAGAPENRAAAWDWFRENFDALVERMAPEHAGDLPFVFNDFCTTERAKEVRDFFQPHMDALPGGPRNLDLAVEAIELCAAKREAQSESANAFFRKQLRMAK